MGIVPGHRLPGAAGPAVRRGCPLDDSSARRETEARRATLTWCIAARLNGFSSASHFKNPKGGGGQRLLLRASGPAMASGAVGPRAAPGRRQQRLPHLRAAPAHGDQYCGGDCQRYGRQKRGHYGAAGLPCSQQRPPPPSPPTSSRVHADTRAPTELTPTRAQAWSLTKVPELAVCVPRGHGGAGGSRAGVCCQGWAWPVGDGAPLAAPTPLRRTPSRLLRAPERRLHPCHALAEGRTPRVRMDALNQAQGHMLSIRAPHVHSCQHRGATPRVRSHRD